MSFQQIAGDVAFALHCIEMAAEREHSEHLQRILHPLALGLSVALTLEEGMRLSVDAAIRVSGMDSGGVYLREESTGDFCLAYHVGLAPEFARHVSRVQADSPRAKGARVGKPAYQHYGRSGLAMDATRRAEGLRAMAVIPVHHEDQVIAVLNVTSHTLEEVPASCRMAMETIAAQIGGAIAPLQAEEALRESRAHYQILTELSPVGIFQADEQNRCTYTNERWTELTGLSPEASLGHGWIHGIHPDDLDRMQAEWETAAKAGTPFRSEYRLVRPDGTVTWVLGQSSATRNEKGTLLGYVGTFTDITERKAIEQERLLLEERLRRSEKLEAVGQLAGGIAHDFNNQLTGISICADMLRKGLSHDDKLRRYAEEIVKATERSGDSIRQLLTFARKTRRESVRVDIHDLIDEVVSLVSHGLGEDITIRTILKASPSIILRDPSQLQNALLNIALNARDAMPDGMGP